MRSQGQVRFIRVSARFQMAGAALVAAALLVWLAIMAYAIVAQALAAQHRAAIAAREAAVERTENSVEKYRKDLAGVAADLEKRQDFLEKTVEGTMGDLPDAPAPDAPGSAANGPDQAALKKIGMVIPEAAPLARMEARQLAFVARLTQVADARSARAETAIRRVGLNPSMMLASAGSEGQGGPLQLLTTGPGNQVDPRFAQLGASLQKMDSLEQGLARIPNTMPSNLAMSSSSFGYRRDPFTGASAFHPGIDFPGPVGSPIFAAATGRVVWAGPRSGYGNCVEVDHGNGLMTRYGHMSRVEAHIGEQVRAGEEIGKIGSTGRSTGPHLHFEVRVNGQAVNPRPFLEANVNVQQEERAGSGAAGA
ncbi:MAG: M23 family metallopeptidase [Sphingomonadales bacterium]|nr:M23 family metallopeptidase [Sphingomonadales bacterium]MDE2569821.1 M23 family metallopeptidase [Sphingomonadales bacterium]